MSSLKNKPDVLIPGYGAQMGPIGLQSGISNLGNPVHILETSALGDTYRRVHDDLLTHAIQSGATAVSPNTFPARHLLRQGRGDIFGEVLRAHIDRMKEVVALHRTHLKQLVFLGSYGDSYTPEEAPVNAQAAKNFHLLQLEALNGYSLDGYLFETICTMRELEGICLAGRSSDLPVIPSVVVDPHGGRLLDGNELGIAVDDIAQRMGEMPRLGINCSSIPGTRNAIISAINRGYSGAITILYPNVSDADPRIFDRVAEKEGVVIQEDTPSLRVSKVLDLARELPRLEILGLCCGANTETTQHFSNKIHSPLEHFSQSPEVFASI